MIKKVLKVVAICFLTCFSFYYTDKVVTFIKSKDDIMIAINEKSKQQYVESIDASIIDNFVFPGICGSSVDIDKSYEKMKNLGSYDDNLLVYKNINPTISVSNIYDKYLKSNSEYEIVLIFNSFDIKSLNNIINIFKSNNVKPTIFVDGLFLNNNYDFLKSIREYIYMENYGYDNNYSDSRIKYTNELLYSINNEYGKYCLSYEEDNKILNTCSSLKMHTFIPFVVKNDSYFVIKENIYNDNIFLLNSDKFVIDELDNILKFIKKKGFDVVSLKKIFSE